MPSNKPRIAIVDLTDCEGCELQFINLREDLLQVLEHVDIVSWRLAGIEEKTKYIDIAFIEGTPLSNQELEELTDLRKLSKSIVALGACAALGGVQASLSSRQAVIAETRTNYRNDLTAHPLSHYIKVDHVLSGCPVRAKDLLRLISELVNGKVAQKRTFPVCLECRSAANECVLLKGQPCLGPLTEGSCEAVCIMQGQHCYGCNGPVEGANFQAFYKLMKTHGYKKTQIDKWVDLFMARSINTGSDSDADRSTTPGRSR